jgi:hypothetical protein
MQSTLIVQFTFLGMSRSTTAGHLPHIPMELRRAEITISASQLEAYEFPENHDIVEQLA